MIISVMITKPLNTLAAAQRCCIKCDLLNTNLDDLYVIGKKKVQVQQINRKTNRILLLGKINTKIVGLFFSYIGDLSDHI